MNGDQIVALLGLVLSLMLVSYSGAFGRMTPRQRLVYGAIWAVIIGAGLVFAAWLAPAGHF